MKFDPKTDEEIARDMLFPDGQYLATIIYASDFDERGNPLLTKKGDPKQNLILKVYDSTGKGKEVRDMVTPAFMKKFKHLCDCLNLQDKYKEGEVPAKFYIDGNVIVDMGTYSYKSEKTGELVTVNQIKDYILKDKSSLKTEEEKIFDDDVPF